MRRIRSLVLLLAATALAVLAVRCARIVTAPCNTADDCRDGLICLHDICLPCSTDVQCGSGRVCRDGACVPGMPAQCTEDGDCGPAPACQSPRCEKGRCSLLPTAADAPCDDGDRCTTEDHCDGTGNCVVSVVRCDEPPAGECRDGDSFYRSYLAPGRCDPATGDCAYDHLDIPCANCTASCLGLCQGIDCSDNHGGCLLENHCDPLLDPPGCTSTNAPDRTPCFLPGEPDVRRGLCASSVCVECLEASDCTGPPGPIASCFDASCTAGKCSYQVISDRVCAAPSCDAGQLSEQRLCGAAGDCPVAGSSSCNGYQCAADGQSCLDSCGDDGDCITAWSCVGGAVCSPDSGLGKCCLDPTTCPGQSCDPGYTCGATQRPVVYRCCPSGELCCDDDGDCASARPGYRCNTLTYSCLVNCSGENDALCIDDYHCDNGVCLPDGAVGDNCNEPSDCGAGLHCQNQVCCAEGKTCCRTHADCVTCEKCDSASSCRLQSASEDLKAECSSTATNCLLDTCSGTATRCGYKAAEADCGTCRSCDASGSCQTNSADHEDCSLCEKCSGGACVDQSSSEDLKLECNPDPDCGSGNCDGNGACDYATSGTSCGQGCGTCDAAGDCSGSCSCRTGQSPIIDGVCGSGIDVELPSGCQYELVHERQSGGSRIQEWETYLCQEGQWSFVEADADIFTCTNCTPPELDRWWDNCGDSSHHEEACP